MSKFKDHFSGHARNYRRYRPEYPAQLLAHIAGESPGRSFAWDCGTGNGQVAIALADHFEKVWASDASARQISEAPRHPRVFFGVERAEQSSLSRASVDAVTAALAVHWFDQNEFVQEALRVLKPSGILAVWSYGDPAINDSLDAALARFKREHLAEHWPPETRELKLSPLKTGDSFDTLLAPEFEIRCSWDFSQFYLYVTTWSAYMRAVRDGGNELLSKALSSLGECWGATTRPVVWPITLQLFRKN